MNIFIKRRPERELGLSQSLKGLYDELKGHQLSKRFTKKKLAETIGSLGKEKKKSSVCFPSQPGQVMFNTNT